MKVGFFAPSYKRPERSITQKIYPMVKLVVSESEAEEYRKNGNDVIQCPDSAQGNVCRVRNWILDNLFGDNDCVVIMDDDCSYVGRWEEQKYIKFDQEDLEEFSERTAILCEELGFKLWGLNCITDKGAYREYTPYGFLQFIGAPFTGHLKGGLRFDESLPLKEDYDLTLQNIQRFGGCLRVNYASYNVKQSEQEGGCATYRNMAREKEQFYRLVKKWGKDIIVRDKGSKRSFDYNPILKVPIKGI